MAGAPTVGAPAPAVGAQIIFSEPTVCRAAAASAGKDGVGGGLWSHDKRQQQRLACTVSRTWAHSYATWG